MAKFTFSKPFSKQIAVGGVVGLSTYSKNIGDVIDGDLISAKGTGEQQVRVLINAHPIQGADMFVIIPISYLTDGNGSEKLRQTGSDNTKSTTPSKSIFTPKNIIIVSLAIGVVFGILKWQKVI